MSTSNDSFDEIGILKSTPSRRRAIMKVTRMTNMCMKCYYIYKVIMVYNYRDHVARVCSFRKCERIAMISTSSPTNF